MNVVDSSAWLEYFADASAARHFSQAIEQTDHLVVPSICVHEVFKAVLRRASEGEALQVTSFMMQGQVVDLDSSLAFESARLGVEFGLPLADSIVYATARECDATVWTQDAHFQNLPGVRYFAKP